MTEQFCLYCGKKLKGRNKKFCNLNCEAEFKNIKEKKISGLEKANRNWEIKVRLTAKERKKIEIKSKDLGLKISPYMRMVSLHSIQIPDQVIL